MIGDGAPPSPAVTLDGIELRIDGNQILAGIDWTIRPDERWVLLGPNGCGKTTLLRLIGFALHPTRGTVTVLGATLGRVDIRHHRHRIGVVSAAVANSLRPTIATADVVMTARHGALEPWWHTYDEDDHARARDLLDRFGIAHLADHELGTLSSGERQRTLLARSLMTEPELLVLDEPTTGLDLGGREALLQDLASLASDPSTPPMVLVTHHVEEIPPGMTHLALMRAGRFVAAGPIGSTMTAEALTECFGLPVELTRHGRRWGARARGVGLSPRP